MAAQQTKTADPPSISLQGIRAPENNVPAVHREQIQIHPGPVMQGTPKDLASLAGKLVKIMQKCGHVEKSGYNDFHKYNYVKAEDVMAALNTACVENKVACIPRFTKVDESEKTQRQGQIAKLVTVAVEVYLIDADTGASLAVLALGTGEDAGDKAVAKAQTMAIKYALMSLCLISTGDDPEQDTRVDMAAEPPVKCKHCGGDALFDSMSEFEGKQVKVYVCPKCKKGTRVKVN